MTTIYSAAPIIGIILAAIIGLIFWKRTSNRPSNERKREVSAKKEEVAKKVEVNTKKQDEIFVEVKEIEKKEEEHEQRIEDVVADTAKEIEDLTKIKDPRETIERIKKNWG